MLTSRDERKLARGGFHLMTCVSFDVLLQSNSNLSFFQTGKMNPMTQLYYKKVSEATSRSS